MCVYIKSLQLCLTLRDPVDCSPPGSSVHELLQARILEWVAMPSSRESSPPRDGTHVSYVSCIGRWVLYHWRYLGSPVLSMKSESQGAQSCPTLCVLMDCSLLGSAVHGMFQARILEWVTMPSSRESSPPRDRSHVSYVS